MKLQDSDIPNVYWAPFVMSSIQYSFLNENMATSFIVMILRRVFSAKKNFKIYKNGKINFPKNFMTLVGGKLFLILVSVLGDFLDNIFFLGVKLLKLF